MVANLRDPGSIPGGDPKRFQDSSSSVFYIFLGSAFQARQTLIWPRILPAKKQNIIQKWYQSFCAETNIIKQCYQSFCAKTNIIKQCFAVTIIKQYFNIKQFNIIQQCCFVFNATLSLEAAYILPVPHNGENVLALRLAREGCCNKNRFVSQTFFLRFERKTSPSHHSHRSFLHKIRAEANPCSLSKILWYQILYYQIL